MLPSPGEGPSQQQRERGSFKMTLLGRDDASGKEICGRVTGTSDPGYGQTSKMLGQCALALATDTTLSELRGILTPAACFGTSLVSRLARSGMQFELQP